jgi:hypothetical protein
VTGLLMATKATLRHVLTAIFTLIRLFIAAHAQQFTGFLILAEALAIRLWQLSYDGPQFGKHR